MMGTNSIPTLILAVLSAAVVAAPAAAAGGYRSADAVVAAAATPPSNSIPSGPEKQLFAGSTGALASSQNGGRLPTPDTYLAQQGKGPDPTQAVRGFGEPAPVAGAAPGSTEEFDWGDAALGAGVALGLIALGGAGLVIRRRMAISPAAPTS